MMNKIKSIKELVNVAQQHRDSASLLVRENDSDGFVLIKVAMATCSMAAGAGEIYDLLREYIEKRGINAVVTKTGCMSYCYAEPTVEVKLPGKEAIVFGNVDARKADEIVELYIKQEELPDGIIPVDYLTMDEVH